jgi:hypothetical protein
LLNNEYNFIIPSFHGKKARKNYSLKRMIDVSLSNHHHLEDDEVEL